MDDVQLSIDGAIDEPLPLADILSLTPRHLQFRDLSAFCRHQIQLIARRSGADQKSSAFLYAQAIKLGEEVGELHAEVLGRERLQRADKQARFSHETIASELADVTICVAILADLVGVDLGVALSEKMDAINHRQASGEATKSDAARA